VQAEQSPVQPAGQQVQVQGDMFGLVVWGVGLVWFGWLCWLWMLLSCEDYYRA
jgi:hypothetical protein